MTDKELRRLSRAELLEILIEQMKENETLRSKLDAANKRLQSREIVIQNAGSIAEAALQLNNVFQAADAAAEQYLENIKKVYEEKQKICDRMEEETRKKCEAMIAEAEARCAVREQELQSHCKEPTAQFEASRDEHILDTTNDTP